jgi:hypothetical protein
MNMVKTRVSELKAGDRFMTCLTDRAGVTLGYGSTAARAGSLELHRRVLIAGSSGEKVLHQDVIVLLEVA